MGIYLNPGNEGFKRIASSEYIDKTGLISLLNERIGTIENLVCISRPRRFGKSYAAQMICAYYDHTCDSQELFDGYAISKMQGYRSKLNRYNVICLDMAGIISDAVKNQRSVRDIPMKLSETIRKELVDFCPGIREKNDLTACFWESVEITGRKFIFVIDEWDAVIREAKGDAEAQKTYFSLLREWFKNGNFTPKVVAAAYMTGILPIKKDGTESAISDFNEYSVLEPGDFAEYTGFTEAEVKGLCEAHHMEFETVKKWYDGYRVGDFGSVYNPYSVMKAVGEKKLRSYWRRTSAAESLGTYININQFGINEDVIKLISGERLKVNVDTFENDFERFASKDDILTLMVHLGYLTYDENTGQVWVPNEEVRQEYRSLLGRPMNTRLADLVKASEQLLTDTLAGNEAAVAQAIEKVRETNYAPQYYNNEQALRYAVKFAYIVCVDRFMRIEELPSGRGLADIVFIPSPDTAYPAIIIELKWNKDESEAAGQIDDRKYATVLEGYVGDIVKVGINYDEASKLHSCKIEKKLH